MKKGDKVRVKANGRVGIAKAIEGKKVYVEFPSKMVRVFNESEVVKVSESQGK